MRCLRRAVRGAASAVAVLLAGCLAGCTGAGSTAHQPTITSTTGPPASGSSSTPSVTASRPPLRPLVLDATLASGLVVPWGLAFLPDGSALIAQRRSGDVVRVTPQGRTVHVGTVSDVADRGEGGLLGLAIARDDPATVFAYLTSTEDDNRVVAMSYDGSRLGPPRVLLKGIPAAGNHDGGRIVIGPDGDLWIGTGDAAGREIAQDRRSLAGKILRIQPDGAVPPDNPFPGSPVWSYGHRNVQGLAFDSAGRLWATEFGQNTWDELNLIEKGRNYGWPIVEGRGGRSEFVDPQVVWHTDVSSPSGLAIVDDVAYVAALRGQRLWRVPLTGGRAGTPEALLTREFGRLRTVEPAPDGTLWITTSNRDGRGRPVAGDDRVLRFRL